jgi:hypothetical protein
MIGDSDPGWGWELFLFTTDSRPALGPSQPPIQSVPGALSPVVWIKWQGPEADHSHPNCGGQECVELYIHSPNTPPWRSAQLKESTGTILRAVMAESVQRSATDWTIGVLGFDSRRGLGIYLFTTVSRTALRHNQPPVQWIPRFLSSGIKRRVRKSDHSPPSSAKVKNVWSYTSTPILHFRGVVLS